MKTLRAAAEGSGTIAEASRIILEPESVRAWFKSVKTVEADSTYPKEGSHMRLTVGPGGRWKFDAEVTENRLPRSLSQRVMTPSGQSRVVHTFTDVGRGRFRYEKTVEPTFSGINRLLAPILMGPIIGRSVKGEVDRAVALVGAAPALKRR